jgi:HK97 family phage prohead protease
MVISLLSCYCIVEKAKMNIAQIRKVHTDDDNTGMEFVLSDATPDRYGDVILAEGWDLDDFKKNPIALFNHNSDFPIGRWENLRVVDGALRGHLQVAPKGTSDRIDEIIKLMDAKILRAVSVGFIPIESQPISKNGYGDLYTKQALVETSLVSVPANPNALAVAKSLMISSATQQIVFAKHGIMETMKRVVGDDGTTDWQGQKIPVVRHVRDVWHGTKLYRY